MTSISDDLEVKGILDSANVVLVIQPDRPDGDSLATALFIEDVLENQNKKVMLYCGVNIPEYLRFLEGWDRVSNVLPAKVDATILVDNASMLLLEKFVTNHDSMYIKTKPFIIADHHTEVKSDIAFATHDISRGHYSSAGELMYDLFTEYKFDISLQAKKLVMQSILSDTLGLTNDLTSSKTYRLMADFIDDGIERSELEEARKRYNKMDTRVFRYKAKLIDRTEFYYDNALAVCVITESESYDVGTLYNPGPLILGELLMVKDVKVAIAIKTYHNRATAAIRCTYGFALAHLLAEKFGGGGHPSSAGFRIENYKGDVASLKRDIITAVKELLA